MSVHAVDCEIVQATRLLPDVFDIRVRNAEIAQASLPGQFVHIDCGLETFLRRPISICDVQGDVIRLVFHVKGKGTKALSEKTSGQCINIIGPLGNGFTVTDKPCAVVGGGIGVFPLLYLVRKLKNPAVFLGFKSASQVLLVDDFKHYCKQLYISTEDGSFGEKGFATSLIGENKPKIASYYACGPTPMLKAVRIMALNEGIPSQLSVEQRMACGVGACLVCACRVAGEYKRVCADGPVFWGREVDFDDNHY